VSDPLNPKRTKSVPLEVTMMKRIGELNKENALLKSEVERLKNNVAYLDKQLDKQLDEEDDGGDSYNHPHAFGK